MCESLISKPVSWERSIASRIYIMSNAGESDEFIIAEINALPENQRRFALNVYDKRKSIATTRRIERMFAQNYTLPTRFIRIGTILPTEFLTAIKTGHPLVKFGVMTKGVPWKMRVYIEKGINCVLCGRKGNMIAIESERNNLKPKYRYHIYNVAEDGTEMMITIDHIIPKKFGGKNTVENAQPLCYDCNATKGHKLYKQEYLMHEQ